MSLSAAPRPSSSVRQSSVRPDRGLAAWRGCHRDGMFPPEPEVSAALSRPPRAVRTILHVDLDCFFVSVERVLDPSLAQRPVVVAGSADERGVVMSASREARASGVHAGMPTAIAQRLCPEATFLPGRGRLYGRASAAAFRLLREHATSLERASIDEAYLDLGLASRTAALDRAACVQAALLERLGLPSSVGIGCNKLVAKIACQQAKPEGILEVWPGYEQAFLAPLPAADLPGVGPVMAERLGLYGLKTIGDVGRVDAGLLEATLGSWGRRLFDRAHGVDDSDLCEDATARTLSHEKTFTRDVSDPARLVWEVYDQAGRVAARLRREGLAGRTITLKLRTADFHTVTRSRTLPAPTHDGSEIAATACFLLRELHSESTPVRLIGVAISRLDAQAMQERLFAAPSATDATELIAGAPTTLSALAPAALQASAHPSGWRRLLSNAPTRTGRALA